MSVERIVDNLSGAYSPGLIEAALLLCLITSPAQGLIRGL